jgi:sRNA-binding carbon storage regulator CsrA
MLVLMRKERERVRITVGTVHIWVKVEEIVGAHQVKLSFDAPREDAVIMREEAIGRGPRPKPAA